MKKNAKALSPVVASIILIAVTVAVSVAVAAWMGGLSLGFMQTEQVAFGTPSFTVGDATSGSVTVNVKNTGTSAVVITEVYLNGVAVPDASITAPAGGVSFTVNENDAVTLTFTSEIGAGYNYEIKVVTSKNNPFTITAIAPA